MRLTDLLDRAGVGDRADQILSTDVDGMTISTPLEVATDGRDAMIAVGMNGEALPREHGFPARMVVPGLYGFVSACKWLTRLTLTTYDEQEAYWTERDWATDAPIKISSRIDTPKSLRRDRRRRDRSSAASPGPSTAASARSRSRSTAAPWQPAELGPSGRRRLLAPVVPALGRRSPASTRSPSAPPTQDGEVQTPAKATPFPDGSSGFQQIIVRVAVRPGHDGLVLRPVTSRSRPRNPAIRPALRSEHPMSATTTEGSTMKRTTFSAPAALASRRSPSLPGLAACGEDEPAERQRQRLPRSPRRPP